MKNNSILGLYRKVLIGHGCMLIGHTSAISKGDVSIAYFPEQVLSLSNRKVLSGAVSGPKVSLSK
jgi:hypothetical protein